ncbi:MAG: S8 family serine peptidase [Xanthomonadales bacterium]|nr:S8 family serine peptidase [Xanthomonadales bacterium]
MFSGNGVFLAAALMHAASQGPGVNADAGTGRYIVQFADPPVVSFEGIQSSDKTWLLEPTAPALLGKSRIAADSAPVKAYRKHLMQRHDQELERISVDLGRKLNPLHRFEYVFSGVSLKLSPDEADQLRGMPGVARVVQVGAWRRMTDAGPTWIGAPQAWEATGSKGEGVVVGVVDSGINWEHPAFADIGGDGYNHSNPIGRTLGLCGNAQVQCNDKLIGVYDFTEEGTRIGRDLDGHGTHVASTAVGNIRSSNVQGVTSSLVLDVSGVAPHANLISYKVCLQDDPDTPDDEGFCLFDAILDAIDQATADNVDIVNFSIGGPTSSPWTDVQTIAMLDARGAGVLTVTSAGNDGPEPDTMSSPANAPWMLTAANSTHNRGFLNTVQEMTGGNANPPGDLTGVGFTGAFGPARIVHARDFGNALCGAGDPELQPLCESHTGSSNPFPPGTFNGEIVVCDRGTYGRVEKGFNLRAAGAGGYILANTANQGESIVSDDHCLPAVHLGRNDGDRLRSWLSAGGDDHRGVISGQTQVFSPALGDQVSSSSSRGPDRNVPGILKPDIAAPGSNILAASHIAGESSFKSGTSMAAPHVAGVAALVLSTTPGLSPSQLHSILTTTALNDGMVDSDGQSPADGFDVGSGRVRAEEAVRGALYLDVSRQEFLSANPTSGGDLEALNMPYLVSDSCLGSCSFTRRVSGLVGGATWTATIEGPASGEVTPSTFELAAGEDRNLIITLEPGSESLNAWVTGYVVLEPSDPTLATARIPYQVFSDPGNLRPLALLSTDQSRGSADILLGGLVALPSAEYQTLGLAKGRDLARTLGEDTTNQDPYDSLTNGVFVETVNLNQDGGVVYARIVPQNNRDIDLYVGRDTNGDGQADESEQLCESITPQSQEQCVLEDARAGTYWILVHNFASVTPGTADRVRVRLGAASPTDTGLVATGPGSVKSAGPTFPVRVIWDRGDMAAGDLWFGALQPKASRQPGLGKVGTTIVELERVADGSAGSQGLPDLDDRESLALVPGEPVKVSLAPFQGHGRMFLDVPDSATSLSVNASGSHEFELSVVRDDAVFTAPDLPLVSGIGSPQAFATSNGASTQLNVSGSELLPGRYYIVPVNSGNIAQTMDLTVELIHDGRTITPVQGLWFNPARDGSGFNLNLSDDQLIIEWYTYLEDGTPTWYLAQGEFPPAGDQWAADLLFFNWDDSTGAAVDVGEVVLTFESPSDLVFSYQVNGFSGSEPYTAIVPDISCASNGTAVEQTGLWFLPDRPGFGYSILSLAGQQVHINYLYDSLGFPRWVLGQGADGNQTLELSQFSGFCPACAFSPVSSVPVGSNAVVFDSSQAGDIATAVTFAGPLSGDWGEAGAMSNLTPTISCD